MTDFNLSTKYSVKNPHMNNTAYPSSKLEANYCHRTHYPKHASYFGDGSGRDTYAVFDNGGLNGHKKPHMQIRKNVHPQPAIPNPRKDPPSHSYIADGSGRDSYVIAHHGGLVNDYGKFKPVGESFKDGLRKHQKINHYTRAYNPNFNSVDIEQFLNWYTPKHQNIFTNRARNQRDLVSKLSPSNKKDWR